MSTYWTFYFLALGSLLALIFFRRSGQIARKTAVDLLKRGAIVVDVRRPAEFDDGHLSQAFNMPVDEIESMLSQGCKDKSRIILLHCKTGLRSKKAKGKLIRMGYENVFDLGSYERAFRIVCGRFL
jgi:rhodanese-related sulfurtransferase